MGTEKPKESAAPKPNSRSRWRQSAIRVGQLLNSLLIERRLLLAQGAERLDLRLVRQIGDHALVRLQAPQDVGTGAISSLSLASFSFRRSVFVARASRGTLSSRRYSGDI